MGGEEREREGNTRHTSPSLLPAPLNTDINRQRAWSARHATSALSLTVDWQWLTMLRRSVNYQLRQIRPTMQSLSEYAAKTLIHAFISSHLEYFLTSLLDRVRAYVRDHILIVC